MTIEQKLFSKLEPHAKRINDGDGNDFDYLPAVLLQLMEEQKRNAKQLENTAEHLTSIKSAAHTTGAQNTAQITAFEFAINKKMEQMEITFKSAQNQLQNSQSSLSNQLETHAKSTQRAHAVFMRLLIVGLVASAAAMGLAVVILQRH